VSSARLRRPGNGPRWAEPYELLLEVLQPLEGR
jgi:hypothetical protein